jgi:hypothetical protein
VYATSTLFLDCCSGLSQPAKRWPVLHKVKIECVNEALIYPVYGGHPDVALDISRRSRARHFTDKVPQTGRKTAPATSKLTSPDIQYHIYRRPTQDILYAIF